jgi:hypothetical protein
VISRDSALFLVGVGLMVYQGFGLGEVFGLNAEFNLWAFLGGMLMTGSPLGLKAMELLSGRAPTAPSLPAPELPPSPEPSTSSSGE